MWGDSSCSPSTWGLGRADFGAPGSPFSRSLLLVSTSTLGLQLGLQVDSTKVHSTLASHLQSLTLSTLSESINKPRLCSHLQPTMAESRRRTLAASGSSSGIPIPASASRPTAGSSNLRASLAPSQQPGPRQSLAPSRQARPSVAFGQSLQSSQQDLPNSQGSQLFSQGHGGPPPREAPMTASRNNMYSSLGGGLGTMSVGRTGTLKSSMQQSSNQPYAPPR